MSRSYAWEKFHAAVSILAAGKRDIRARLHDAYISALMRVEPEDLPEDIRDDFNKIDDELTSVEPVGDEGSAMASVRAMTEDRASEIAEQIVSMFSTIARNYPEKG